MAHKKGGGTAKNLTDSNPQYLGIKLYDGEVARPGMVILRQRGTKIMPGENTRAGVDHTIFSMKTGTVKYSQTRKLGFNNVEKIKKIVKVVEGKYFE